ncbi:MAG: amidohydrolase family protein [Anaerolineae bacterium]
MMVVDAHCHVGIGHEYRQSVADLLADMDRCGVDRAVICPVDRCLAVDNREGNDLMLATARAYPNRFYPFATANPWYGPRAVAELRRAIGEGARGIKLHPPLQGFLLCDDLVYPLMEVADALAVPVYFHTGTPAFAQPMQLAELALRFPQVNLIMGHMGSTDFKADALPAASMAPNIYLDTSWILPELVTRAVAEVGPERVIFSSDTPLSDLPLELELRAAARMDEAARAMLMGGNILRLLGESL